MRQVPSYLLLGNGRVSRHFQHYFTLSGLSFHVWQRADGVEQLQKLLPSATHVLLLINDKAIEELAKTISSDYLIHFSGSLVTDLAYGAHPLMTFSYDLYNEEQYRAIPFIIDEDAPDFSDLLPGLPNPHFRLDKKLKAKYHALCVLSGNFSCLLWNKLFDEFENELKFPASIAHPYLRQQMQNLMTNPKQALTGPLIRGDQVTIDKNIQSLSGDEYQDVYKSFIRAATARKRAGSEQTLNEKKTTERGTNMSILEFQRKKREREKISVVTCYDYTSAIILSHTAVDCLFIGDSVAMTMHGFKSTLNATMEMMCLHTAAVSRGAGNKFILADLPFMSYRKTLSKSMSAAQQLMQAGSHAVKLEGADGNLDTIRQLVESGVPVMGHLGLTPQSVHQLGGYKVQGVTEAAAGKLKKDALALQQAGCFSLVLECVPATLAAEITRSLIIPTIGIGAGAETDGQVLVWQDMLGMNKDFKPKFVKTFMNGFEKIQEAIETYVSDINNGEFPRHEHSF